MKSIFVSSTFRDMQSERDAFMLSILPELNAYAGDFGESVRFVDLRWGVNTTDLESDEGSKKVLSVCLDEIDQTRPYIIVLIGQRYGWVPEKELLEHAAAQKRFSLLDVEKSVTELEIEYGALAKQDALDCCLFYFRDPLVDLPEQQRSAYMEEKPALIEKLEGLKAKIRASGAKIQSYQCSWDEKTQALQPSPAFAQMVVDDVKALFAQEFIQNSQRTWQAQELLSAQVLMEVKAAQFAARTELLRIYEKQIVQHNLFFLQGAPGSGKTTMMAKLAQEMQRQYCTFFFACGNGARSQSAQDILEQMVYQLEEVLGYDTHFGEEKSEVQDALSMRNSHLAYSIADWRNQCESLAYAYQVKFKKPLFFFIDAVDQLAHDDMRDALAFLPTRMPMDVHIVVSALSSFALPAVYPLQCQSVCAQLLPLSASETPKLILGILHHAGKELNLSLIQAMIQDPALQKTPLHLSLLLQRLVMLDSDDFGVIARYGNDMNAINRYLLEVIETAPQTPEGMAVEILREAGERINQELCGQAVLLLAASRRGLRESDLAAIFAARGWAWNALDFARLRKYMQPFFLRRADGRIDFTHRTFRIGLMAQCEASAYHQSIFDCLAQLPFGDVVRQSELAWHAYQANQISFMADYIVACDQRGVVDAEQTPQGLFIKTARILCAKTIHEIALQDEAWVCALIKKNVVPDTALQFAAFFSMDVEAAFVKSMQEQAVMCTVLRTLREALAGADGAQDSMRQSDIALIGDILGNAYVLMADYEKAAGCYEISLQINDRLSKETQAFYPWYQLAQSHVNVGDLYRTTENLKDALLHYERSEIIMTELVGVQARTSWRRMLSICKERLGTLQNMLENNNAAFEKYNESKKISQVLVDELNTQEAWHDLAIAYAQIGVLQEACDKMPEALASLSESKKIYDRLVDAYDTLVLWREMAVVYAHLGTIQEKLGEREEAIERYQHSANIRRSIKEYLQTPQSRQDFAGSIERLGDMQMKQEDYKEASTLYQESKTLYLELAEESGTPAAYRFVAGILDKQSDAEDFLMNEEKAMRLQTQRKNILEAIAQRVETLEAWEDLALCLKKMGEMYYIFEVFEQSISLYQQSNDVLKKIAQEGQESEQWEALAAGMQNLGEVCELRGKIEDAFVHYKKSCNVLDQLAQSVQTGRAYYKAFVGYYKLAEVQYGQSLYEDCIESYENCERVLLQLYQLSRTAQVKGWLTSVVRNLGKLYRRCNLPEKELETQEKLKILQE